MSSLIRLARKRGILEFSIIDWAFSYLFLDKWKFHHRVLTLTRSSNAYFRRDCCIVWFVILLGWYLLGASMCLNKSLALRVRFQITLSHILYICRIFTFKMWHHGHITVWWIAQSSLGTMYQTLHFNIDLLYLWWLSWYMIIYQRFNLHLWIKCGLKIVVRLQQFHHQSCTCWPSVLHLNIRTNIITELFGQVVAQIC